MKKIVVALLIAGLLLAGCITTAPEEPNGPDNPDAAPPNPADIPQPPENPEGLPDDVPPTLPF